MCHPSSTLWSTPRFAGQNSRYAAGRYLKALDLLYVPLLSMQLYTEWKKKVTLLNAARVMIRVPNLPSDLPSFTAKTTGHLSLVSPVTNFECSTGHCGIPGPSNNPGPQDVGVDCERRSLKHPLLLRLKKKVIACQRLHSPDQSSGLPLKRVPTSCCLGSDLDSRVSSTYVSLRKSIVTPRRCCSLRNPRRKARSICRDPLEACVGRDSHPLFKFMVNGTK